MTDTYPVDFYDYEITVKQASAKSRAFIAAFGVMQKKYARRERMIEDGLLSEEAATSLANDRRADLAKVYAEHIITGWKGIKHKGKALPFSKENVIKFLSDKENDLIFGEIMDQSAEQSNFIKAQEDAESKNSVKS